MDIEAFKASFSGVGLSSGNRYNVNLPFLSQDECMLCCSAELPSVTFNTFGYRQPIPLLRLPFDLIYEPLQLTFYLRDDGQPKLKLEQWKSQIFNTDFRFNDFDSYATGNNIIVQVLSKQDSPIGTYTYHNCYPTQVGPTSVGYEQRNQVSRFSVSFYYESSTVE